MILRTLIPAVVAWMLCHGKHKAVTPVPHSKNARPNPLEHMLDELEPK